MSSPREGRRPLAQVMHDPKAANPANPGACGRQRQAGRRRFERRLRA
ncbi:hypothetical protein LP420_41345 [Massilia sp. B-10]|nr:hypothetical protein LP420_41345 [Massilia sp. B-10]